MWPIHEKYLTGFASSQDVQAECRVHHHIRQQGGCVHRQEGPTTIFPKRKVLTKKESGKAAVDTKPAEEAVNSSNDELLSAVEALEKGSNPP